MAINAIICYTVIIEVALLRNHDYTNRDDYKTLDNLVSFLRQKAR